MEISRSDRVERLRLIRSESVGPITFHRLIERFGSAKEALERLPELARRGGRAARIRVCSEHDAERELAAVEKLGGQLIAMGEPQYPPLLAHTEDAPPLISVLGHSYLLTKRAIAVVGARNASVNGLNMAKRLAIDLGAAGLLVVSGMARGIDAAAHEGALATGTVAVLGGGVDVVYPKENKALYTAISEQGTLISEVAPGTQPQARHFPRRNRLISGMARGVVVVEASPRSGSLITARLALELGREVFAVPGSPADPRGRGANRLIREGATLTECAADVLEQLNGLGQTPAAGEKKSYYQQVMSEPIDESAINQGRPRIEESLDFAPLAVDELIRNCQLSPAVVATVLLELELAGRLERHPGNRVSLTTKD